jgi:pimeloyl-ACP methyl ester carboxylesterase
MVTGDTASMSLWMPYLLRPLARHFTVTIFDNRGVGYSTDDLARPLTVPLMARDTGALIEALGLVKPTLVGWSMGGEIGAQATARFIEGFEAIPQEQVLPRALKRQEAAEEAFLRYPGTWRGLPGIGTPTLITNGALDEGVPPVNARRMHARIPGSALSIYPTAAHGMLFQDAERFAAQIAAFSAGAR